MNGAALFLHTHPLYVPLYTQTDWELKHAELNGKFNFNFNFYCFEPVLTPVLIDELRFYYLSASLWIIMDYECANKASHCGLVGLKCIREVSFICKL